MTNPGLLDFFTLEASEYVEQMDGLLGAASAEGPDAATLMKHARGLRGAAQMARMPMLSELAGSIERAAKVLREGLLMWEPGLQGALVAAIDDLKILLRAVRTWGTAEDQRAHARIAELSHWAPGGPRLPTPAPSSSSGTTFFANGASDIAKAIDAFLARGHDRGALDDLLRHTRTLRGAAAIRDLPPLPDIVEAVERAAKPMELTAAPPTAAQISILTSASTILRDAAQSLGVGQYPSIDPETLRRLTAAAAAISDATTADAIVPIAELFHADAGPHVVSAAPNPPTTPAQRFRLEVVSQAEHLRGLVSEAQYAADPASRERASRELRAALRALKSAAEGFGEHGVSAFVDAAIDAASRLDPSALAAVDEAAFMLSQPNTRPDQLAVRLGQLAQTWSRDQGFAGGLAQGVPGGFAQDVPGGFAQGVPGGFAQDSIGGFAQGPPVDVVQRVPAAPAPAPAPPLRPPPADFRQGRGLTPTGRPLDAVLDQTISHFAGLDERPFSEPAPIPIDALLYRGPTALVRAREIRDALRTHAGAPNHELLAELYDLLDLAAAE